MTHYAELFDPSQYVAAHELQGRDVTVTISKVLGGIVEGEKGRKNKKPILHFKGATKPFVCNKTNAKTIAAMYGPLVEKWVGQRVTLYPTTTTREGETVPTIRIRPKKPSDTVQDGKIVEADVAAEGTAATEESPV
jgi:hypothetical protein